jgi:hypothetical protein
MQLRRIPAKIVSLSVVTTAGAYSAADQVGEVMKVTDASQDSTSVSILRSVCLVDKGKQSVDTDILFFSEAPTNSVLDNGPADISDAEMAAKCIGVVKLVAADYSILANNSVATKAGLSVMLQPSLARSKDLYVLVVTRGTPTYASVQDLTLRLAFEQC